MPRRPTWLGIDFSGNHLMYRPTCRRSNVWVARVEEQPSRGYVLCDLRVVQDLPGHGDPFDRLVSLVQAGDFDAAGIDAPFSLPAAYAPRDYQQLLRTVGSIACAERPFPRAHDFLVAVAPALLPHGMKLYRETETAWLKQGVNTRSTIWAGPRGGTAMTAACLKLLHTAQTPVWPWARGERGLLVESFPAAQLKTWGLENQRYNGNGAEERAYRESIVKGLGLRVELGAFRGQLLDRADALDAVVAAFGAIAVMRDHLAYAPGILSGVEGMIAVHR